MVALAGEMDRDTTRTLVKVLTRAPPAEHPPPTVLDLSQVTFCDSAGLGALIAIRNAIGASGGRLALANPPAQPRRMITRMNLDRILQMHDTLDEAIAALNRNHYRG